VLAVRRRSPLNAFIGVSESSQKHIISASKRLAANATGECLGHVDLLKGDEAIDSGQRVVDDPAIDGPIIYGEYIQLRNINYLSPP
jgi:hypothetical protein